jgi:hypothetical protein
MIKQLPAHGESALGFTVSGDVTKDDYAVLTPAVEAAIAAHGTVQLLLDLTDFHWEKVSAWSSDLHFGKETRHNVSRMALVGHKNWERHLATVAQPFYAKEVRFFEIIDDAWAWIDGPDSD